MNVLILKNITNEGPGTIEEYLRDEGMSYSIVDLRQGERLPDVSLFTHLVIMGGPMAVYEMDRHPFLREEAGFILKATKSNRHVLGICLGAQMLAHVLGSKVYAGGRKEIGWHQAAITPEGMRDTVMATLAQGGKPEARVFQPRDYESPGSAGEECAVTRGRSRSYKPPAPAWGGSSGTAIHSISPLAPFALLRRTCFRTRRSGIPTGCMRFNFISRSRRPLCLTGSSTKRSISAA